MPAVSVLMPVRDAEGTVMRAVESIQSQSLRDWELVIVNDGSRDATPRLLEAARRLDGRLRVLHLPPCGIAPALNAGLAACRAPCVARMDADDLAHPARLELQLRHMLEQPATGLVSCRVSYQGAGAGYAEHVEWINALGTHEEMSLRRFVEAPVAHPSVMFRRELVDKHGGYRDGPFPEDYELWLRWLEAGARFEKLSESLLVWNDPPQRLSRTDPRYSVAAFYEIKTASLARWLRAQAPEGRALWLWGAGRVTRRRFDALERQGIRLAGFIDVDPAKRGSHRDGRPVRMADELPEREGSFILAGVAARGARGQIHAHLAVRGWREGADFLLVA
ncbi:MAG TPA: glycosyl transferase family 2 [Verrucomicrobiales bacterium]|nr:glycosyl transferase family 2 [Verrucomicrobiales bacterium]